RALRRRRHQRHRPRGRRLRARLLLRPEDTPDHGRHHAMSTLTLDDVYLDNDAFRDRVPHEVFTLLRNESPVHWYDWEHGKGFWCITRYDDIVTVLKDWRTFSSETGATALEDLDADQIEARKSMLDTDPPEHSSLRAIVNKGFTPRAVAAYEDLLRQLTQQILDEALPQGEFDFVE